MTAEMQKNSTTCCTPGGACDTTVKTQQVAAYLPVVDVVETPDEYRVVADVPGVRPEDVEVTFEKGTLTLHARVGLRSAAPDNAQPRNYLMREYGVGDFRRTFRVGEGIAIDRISADVVNGVLTLRLPKAEETKPRRIPVTAV